MISRVDRDPAVGAPFLKKQSHLLPFVVLDEVISIHLDDLLVLLFCCERFPAGA